MMQPDGSTVLRRLALKIPHSKNVAVMSRILHTYEKEKNKAPSSSLLLLLRTVFYCTGGIRCQIGKDPDVQLEGQQVLGPPDRQKLPAPLVSLREWSRRHDRRLYPAGPAGDDGRPRVEAEAGAGGRCWGKQIEGRGGLFLYVLFLHRRWGKRITRGGHFGGGVGGGTGDIRFLTYS